MTVCCKTAAVFGQMAIACDEITAVGDKMVAVYDQMVSV
jgi:hypothetical protein